MNIFIIHSGTDKENVEAKVREINKINNNAAHSNKANVLLLEYKTFWKPEVIKLIKSAQIVLYILSEDGHNSKNIDWEIKQAKKNNKAIIILNEGKYTLNSSLYEDDPFTKISTLVGTEISTVNELFEIIENYENGSYISLFNKNSIDLDILFEQYKLFSDTSESLVTRRQNVNSFYITANTAIITIAATAFSLNDNLISQLILTIALTFPGLLLNITWLKVLDSYTLVNSSKLKILTIIEKKLAASLYDAEWEIMSNKYNKIQYISSSEREKLLPIVFNWVFTIVDITCILIILFQLI